MWGPPGTGKTRVLRSAIGDLLTAGKRVLLVSGTNIAVDNALHETLKERAFAPGEIVRVGPPHLKEIADNPEASLPLMVRAKLAEVEEARHAAAEELRAMNDRRERLESLDARLADFDPAAYENATALLAVPGRSVAELSAALTSREEAADQGVPVLESARAELDAALTEVAKARPVLAYWTETDRLTAHLTEVEQDATQAEARALRAKTVADKANDDVVALEKPNRKVRWGSRHAYDEARQRLDEKRRAFEEQRAAAVDARRIAAAARQHTEREIARLATAAPLSREEIQRRDNDAALARTRLRALEHAQRALFADRTQLAAALTAARAAAELVADCDRRGWPALQTEAAKLRGATARDSASRRSAEARYDELQKQFERMEKDARG
ncbi:MAG TPA: AAA domain-containing protein, partial [Trebonia sp.]|nr:AAA domain-containing protein [Trebonia sp.]